MADKKIAEMTDEELATTAAQLEADRLQLRDAQRAVGAEQETRALAAAAAEKLAKMSDKEKALLRELLKN